jgi:hypothetical protein
LVAAHRAGCTARSAGGENTAALRERLCKSGFDFPIGNRAHGDLSTKILADELAGAVKWPAVDRILAQNVAIAVGGHHGVLPNNWDDAYMTTLMERLLAALGSAE